MIQRIYLDPQNTVLYDDTVLTISWDDGTTDDVYTKEQIDDIQHDYAAAGSYTITISAVTPSMSGECDSVQTLYAYIPTISAATPFDPEDSNYQKTLTTVENVVFDNRNEVNNSPNIVFNAEGVMTCVAENPYTYVINTAISAVNQIGSEGTAVDLYPLETEYTEDFDAELTLAQSSNYSVTNLQYLYDAANPSTYAEIANSSDCTIFMKYMRFWANSADVEAAKLIGITLAVGAPLDTPVNYFKRTTNVYVQGTEELYNRMNLYFTTINGTIFLDPETDKLPAGSVEYEGQIIPIYSWQYKLVENGEYPDISGIKVFLPKSDSDAPTLCVTLELWARSDPSGLIDEHPFLNPDAAPTKDLEVYAAVHMANSDDLLNNRGSFGKIPNSDTLVMEEALTITVNSLPNKPIMGFHIYTDGDGLARFENNTDSYVTLKHPNGSDVFRFFKVTNAEDILHSMHISAGDICTIYGIIGLTRNTNNLSVELDKISVGATGANLVTETNKRLEAEYFEGENKQRSQYYVTLPAAPNSTFYIDYIATLNSEFGELKCHWTMKTA